LAKPVLLTLTDPRSMGFFGKLALTRTPDPNRLGKGIFGGGGISRRYFHA